jgi:hypothetical protein
MTTHYKNNIQHSGVVQSEGQRWLAPILRSSVWRLDDANTNKLDVSFVEPSLRRKLSLLVKISLKVAHDCTGQLNGVHLVFASRHGDLSGSTEMLNDLAEAQPISPTTFSMSVLNAFAGVFSISKQEQLSSTSITAGRSSFGFGLLEACLQWMSHPAVPVLYVYADIPASPLYRIASGDAFTPHAIALLLSSEAKMHIMCEMHEASSHAQIDTRVQSDAFIDCLSGSKTQPWQDEGRVWTWRQRAD